MGQYKPPQLGPQHITFIAVNLTIIESVIMPHMPKSGGKALKHHAFLSEIPQVVFGIIPVSPAAATHFRSA